MNKCSLENVIVPKTSEISAYTRKKFYSKFLNFVQKIKIFFFFSILVVVGLGHLSLPRKAWALELIPAGYHGRHVWFVNSLHLSILIVPRLSGKRPLSLELYHHHHRIPAILWAFHARHSKGLWQVSQNQIHWVLVLKSIKDVLSKG